MRWAWIVLVAGCAQQFGLKHLPDVDAAIDAPDAPPSGTWAQVGTGADLTCGLTTAGRVYCWTVGTGEPAMAVDPTQTFTDLSVGAHQACGVAMGAAYCWGGNDAGQADPSNVGVAIAAATPARIPIPAMSGAVTHVTAGSFHSCALAGTDVYCWGNSQQAGGSTRGPNQMGTGKVFSDVSAGYDHSCAITSDGYVWCWGGDSHGESSGNLSSPVTQAAPIMVAIGPAVALRAGFLSSCALRDNGSIRDLYCWGDGLVPLSDSTNTTIIPTKVVETSAWNGIVMGNRAMCALTVDHAECWGVVLSGGLGDGNLGETIAPTGSRVHIQSTQIALELSSDNGEHAASIAHGAITFWGPPASPVSFPAPP